MVAPSFLVVGGGSIGERHLRCLGLAGCKKLGLVEPIAARRQELRRRYFLRDAWSRLEDADLSLFTHAVVATPPAFHLAGARRLVDRGIHALIEKPLCADLREADAFTKLARSKRAHMRTAYSFRCAKIVREARKRIDKDRIGAVRIFQAISGQFFPRFRPDYLKIYWADPQQGGTSLDALTHSVDLAMWQFGRVEWAGGLASNLGLKRAKVDDTASLILKGPKGEQAVISVNLFQAPNEAKFHWIGEKGSLIAESPAGILREYAGRDAAWRNQKLISERDDAYVLQAKLFARETSGASEGLCTVPEAAENLRLCLKVRNTFLNSSANHS